MSLVEPGQDRTIGPAPAEPAHFTGDDVAVPAEVLHSEPVADAEPDTFDREYVHKLRDEAASWRTQLRETQAKFEGVDPETIDALVEFARLSKAAEAGDQDALLQLQEMLGEAPAPAETPWDEERFRQLAREEATRLVTEQTQAQAQEAAVRGIVATAEKMGYKQGTEDYILLMRAANALDPSEHPDLLATADEQVKAYKQGLIEAYLASKEAETNGSPQVPQAAGSPPGTQKLPWDPGMTEKQKFAAVRESFRERLNAG